MNRSDKIEKEIREYWFKNHKANITNYGDVCVLDWRNPESNNYQTRYVFDGYNMYISGDIGDAVFNLTWKANVHSFNDVYIGYFLSKMSTCSNGKYDFDGIEAEKHLEQWKSDLIEENEFTDEEKEKIISTIDDMISDAYSCSSESQWAWEFVNEKYNEFISENDCDYYEWIYTIGNVIPYHNHAFLIGLQMASTQLKEAEAKK